MTAVSSAIGRDLPGLGVGRHAGHREDLAGAGPGHDGRAALGVLRPRSGRRGPARSRTASTGRGSGRGRCPARRPGPASRRPGSVRPLGSRSTLRSPGVPVSDVSYCSSSPDRPSLSTPTWPRTDLARSPAGREPLRLLEEEDAGDGGLLHRGGDVVGHAALDVGERVLGVELGAERAGGARDRARGGRRAWSPCRRDPG